LFTLLYSWVRDALNRDSTTNGVIEIIQEIHLNIDTNRQV